MLRSLHAKQAAGAGEGREALGRCGGHGPVDQGSARAPHLLLLHVGLGLRRQRQPRLPHQARAAHRHPHLSLPALLLLLRRRLGGRRCCCEVLRRGLPLGRCPVWRCRCRSVHDCCRCPGRGGGSTRLCLQRQQRCPAAAAVAIAAAAATTRWQLHPGADALPDSHLHVPTAGQHAAGCQPFVATAAAAAAGAGLLPALLRLLRLLCQLHEALRKAHDGRAQRVLAVGLCGGGQHSHVLQGHLRAGSLAGGQTGSVVVVAWGWVGWVGVGAAHEGKHRIQGVGGACG